MSGPFGEELTHSQTGIWVGQRLHPESPLYNMAFVFAFSAELRADLFAEAWRRVVDENDILRTRIAEREGVALRVVDSVGPKLEILDLSSRAEPELELARWSRERSERPLPLDGDLVESVLIGLGEGRTAWYLNQHHLITDAWSTDLLYRRVAEEYEALLEGDDSERPGLEAYYPTVAALPERAGERAAAAEHWASRQTRPGRLVPLYGRSGDPEGTASRRLALELDEERSRRLRELSREKGFASLSRELSIFTVFATLLVSWLHRISGVADLGFDTPVAGRPTPEAKKALGLFIEMFPFAGSVEPEETFRTLGATCLKEAMLMLRHALPGTSAPSTIATGNVVLNFVPVTFGDFAGQPVEVDWVHPGHGDSVHALRLQVHDFSGSGRYTLHFDGNEEALPERLRRRGLRHFEKILDAFLEDPDQPIARVDVLVEDEVASLARLNGTDGAPLPDRTVVDLFREQAGRDPDGTALEEGGSELTYSELLERSESLAAHLVGRGLEPGDRVAVFGRRSISSVVAILAVLRARGAYVPIDPLVPQARREQILHDSGARMLLVDDGAAVATGVPGVTLVSVAESVEAGRGKTLDRSGPELGDPAYLIYTSGSTGRPKGVLVEHGGLADYLQWASRRYVRGDSLTFPLFTSLAFDLTVTSLFLPLITGGRLVIYPQSGEAADTALMDVVRDNAVDFIKLTPSHLSLLRRVGLEDSRIRRMVVGGEDLKTSLAAAISDQLHGRVEIHNEYGPTEAVVGCVAHLYDPEVDTAASVPIGRPADHVKVEILNEALEPVPEGVPGELWISRFGLARGYHGQDELSARVFVERPGGRSYRTGDLVRLVGPEKLEYLGRLDRQLKVSGFRVEPGEIEDAMSSLPGIEACAVVAHRRVPVDLGPEASEAGGSRRHCSRCGLPSDYPRAVFDDEGVCSICRSYESTRKYAQVYFKTMDDLRELFEASAEANESDYDCLVLYSGGKDSTYALCRLVDLGLKVYAFTLDNGYIAEGAKENIRQVTGQLGVPVEFAETPAMNAIFRDSLQRFSNVCNGCFKTIYTLSLARARELRIPIIVTGLSRGQMFETRLTEEMFRDGRCSPEEVDAAVLAARKVYHQVPDEVTRSLNAGLFDDDRIFEEVEFVDFYRYCDVGMDELYAYLRERVSWVRPKDTGRSTNCLINDTGIWLHKKERGFHNYALPYSWDVRMGHKTREAALEELDDDIDVDDVREKLAEVGYEDASEAAGHDRTVLDAFYVTATEISEDEIRQRLAELLPRPLVPAHLQRVDDIPLTVSGKVDEAALAGLLQSRDERRPRSGAPYRAPRGPVQEYLAELWRRELEVDRIGGDDDFFELGGTSLAAMKVMLELCREFAIELPLETLFTHPTMGKLARVAEDRILEDVAAETENVGPGTGV